MNQHFGRSIAESVAEAQHEKNVAHMGFVESFRYIESPPISRWTRIWWRVLDLRDRIRDAWLVLIGRANISDD